MAIKRNVAPRPELDAESWPYVITKPHGDKPKYCRNWKAAREAIQKDLDGLRDMFWRLKAQDAVDAIDALIREAQSIGVDGGTIRGVIDPVTGTKFEATLTRRKSL